MPFSQFSVVVHHSLFFNVNSKLVKTLPNHFSHCPWQSTNNTCTSLVTMSYAWPVVPLTTQSYPATPLHIIIVNAPNLVEYGCYADVISSLIPSTSCFYFELMNRVNSCLMDKFVNEVERDFIDVLVMCVAVSAFLGFTRSNLVRPRKIQIF